MLAQPTALGPDDIATGQAVPDTDPNVVNPFPTTGGNTDSKARDEARKNLNTAQAELAAERQSFLTYNKN